MENKDQRNQIPENPNGKQDEKTSQTENEHVEASPQTDEDQDAQATTSDEVKEKEPIADATNAPAVSTAKQDEPAAEKAEQPEPEQEPATDEVKDEVNKEDDTSATPETSAAAMPEENKSEAEETQIPVEEKAEASATPETPKKPEVEQPEETSTEEPEKPVVEQPEKTEVEKPVEKEVGQPGEPQVERPEKAGNELPVEIKAEQPEDAKPGQPKEEKVEQEEETKDEQPVANEETEDDDEDDHDEHDEHEEQADIAIPNYEELEREKLIEHLETLVGEDDVTKIKSRIALIKVAFLHKTKEAKETSYQGFLEDGGEKEDYTPEKDELEARFNELFDVYRKKRAVYLNNLEIEKQENLKKKKAILDDLKELIGSEETLKKTYDDFRALQDSWRQIGMVPKSEVNNLWQTYHFLVEKFFDKVKINKELKDLDLKKNLELKIELCEKVEELLIETSIIKSFRQLQRYHEKWKEIGPVPEDKNDEIWERFKSSTDKINQRRRDHYKQLQEEQENNLAAKVALCEKAENLLTEEVTTIRGWQERTRQFNDLFKVWKTIGQAPKKQNDEIWERFKTSLDTFFSEKKEYFARIKEQQVNNYNMKLELCLQAESLKDSDDWRNTTRDLINLQKEWKNIGPVPRKNADKIWQRFRKACDEFFNRKSEHFSGVREEETENLKKKEELIKQVENHEFDENKSKNLEILKDFQRQWTEIGFVPFKDKDRLQNAFRNAINTRLDKLNISNSEMSLAHYSSKLDVLKNTPDGNRQLQREQTFIQNKIAKLREDIMLWENNIGFLADTKNASIFKSEFEKKIEKAKSELGVLETKLKILYK